MQAMTRRYNQPVKVHLAQTGIAEIDPQVSVAWEHTGDESCQAGRVGSSGSIYSIL